MANNNAEYVSTAKPKAGGAIYVAPLGTTLPTDAKTALASTFQCVGLISEDGVTRSFSKDSTEIKDWSGATVKTVVNSSSETDAFTMIEFLNAVAQKVAFGDSNVTVGEDGSMTVKHNATDAPEKVFVIDSVMLDGSVSRTIIPDGKVTANDDLTYKADTALSLGVTVTALADKDGNTSIDYTEVPTVA